MTEPELNLLALAHSVTRAYRDKCGPVCDYDEMLSDACYGIAKSLKTFDPARGHLRDWLFNRAWSEIIDGSRRRADVPRRKHKAGLTVRDLPAWQQPATHLQHDDVERDAPDRHDRYGEVDARLTVQRLLEVLPDPERHAVTAYYLADQPQEHVAAGMGFRPGSGRVAQLLTAARQRMREAA